MRPQIYILMLMLILMACAPAAAPATPTPDFITLPTALPGQSRIDIDLPPRGTPEADPYMVFKVRIFDEQTKEPLEGNVFWSELPVWMGIHGEDMVGMDIHGINLVLDGQAHGWLAVAVPGYEMWRLEIRYRVESSRWLEMPVWMVREGGGDGKTL